MSPHDTSPDEVIANLPLDRSAFYQNHLDRVSRSFALGIRQLAEPSRGLIGLSYLLFRLLDTIEDSPWISRQGQIKSFEMFEKFIEREPERHEIRNWTSAFPSDIPKGEKLLLNDAHILLADYHRLESTAHEIVRSGVLSMSRGMQHFIGSTEMGAEFTQQIKLKSVLETDQYCFFVAGIVGELLTKIVRIDDPFLISERMLGDAFHFGLFLQKINLLKDQREDATQGRFLVPDREIVRRSVDVHARRALRYLQSLPVQLREYRLFCAWALYLGLASLPWIDRAWRDGSAGKMPRSQALPLLERLRKIIDDNNALGVEGETYLRSATVLNFDSHLRPDLIVEPWFAAAYSGELTKAELAGLGVLRSSTEAGRLDHEGQLAIEIEQAIANAEKALLARQKTDGSWAGEVGFNPGPTAQVIMLHGILRKEFPLKLAPRAAAYLWRTQNDDGGWNPSHGAPSEVSLSVACYVALRLLGFGRDEKKMSAAAQFIRRQNRGLDAVNTSTRLYLSELGILPWPANRSVPIELLLLLKWSAEADWLKASFIPIAVLRELGQSQVQPVAVAIAIELGVASGKEDAHKKNRVLQSLNRLGDSISRLSGLKFLRKRALERAWNWIDQVIEVSGDFGGNPLAIANVLLALYRGGRGHEPRFAFGYASLMSYGFDDGKEWRMPYRQSSVWDTSLSLKALPANSPVSGEARRKAKEWLLDQQTCNRHGEGASFVSAETAGWGCCTHCDHFPSADCTALVLQALNHERAPSEAAENELVQKAINWLLAKQQKSGGWVTSGRQSEGILLKVAAKVIGLDDVIIDTPLTDVSSLVINALSGHRAHSGVSEALVRARSYILNERNEGGLWPRNNEINCIYGTAFACTALRAVDRGVREEWALSSREFFMRTQKTDGGWGESGQFNMDIVLAGSGVLASSVVQTSWALLGLCACQIGLASESTAIRRAVKFLIERQNPNGEWADEQFLSIFLPDKLYFQNELHAISFPILALDQARLVLNSLLSSS